ncbi:MAG: RNA polymerase sigma factor [Parcubacteria group bacterium]|jgi:RNA polymerase sigma-70 factor (ECF subfamily)
MHEEDKNLIQAFFEGDDEAYEKLLKKYLKSVYNFLRTFVRDSDTLDDLTQETFFKAWKNLKSFDTEKNFKTWLFTIAKNTAYDFFKKKKTIPFSNFLNEEGDNVLENIKAEDILPLEVLEKAEREKVFETKLAQLPTDYHALLMLRYKEDFSLQEISEILAVPYSTIKSRHLRALNNLKEILLSSGQSAK